jgi:hypothetical protein
MTEQRISTPLTLLLQLLLPVPLVALVLALATEGLASAIAAFTLALTGFWAYAHFIWPLRTVYASRYGIRVLSRGSSVLVRYGNLASASRILRRWDTVEITFREPVPPLGPSIMFMAPPRLFWASEPPVLQLLHERALEADRSIDPTSA